MDGPQEMERNKATAKHVAWSNCTWLLLSFFPFPVGHPPCTCLVLPRVSKSKSKWPVMFKLYIQHKLQTRKGRQTRNRQIVAKYFVEILCTQSLRFALWGGSVFVYNKSESESKVRWITFWVISQQNVD